MKKILFIVLLAFFSLSGYSQTSQRKVSAFPKGIEKNDLSMLWSENTAILNDDDEDRATDMRSRPEPVGYIGDDYQRFYIHFISVIQNKNNPLEYYVYGKSKVKNNICDFQGIMKVKEIKEGNQFDAPILESDYKQGIIRGGYTFFEDAKQSGTGIFQGEFTSYFAIDRDGKLKYNALDLIADGYKNNQFQGTWESYQTGAKKKCNWGDFRIPERGDLDVGTAEFNPDPIFYDKGWQNYKNMFEDSPEGREARKKELEKWWK